MKCPKCGLELTEGNLYCINCGEEIRIVPDFEPDIENELNETLSSLAMEMEEEGREKEPAGEEMTDIMSDPPGRYTGKRFIIVLLAICLLSGIAGSVGLSVYREQSSQYQLKKAEEYAAAADYGQAISYMEKALKLEPENADILFKITDYYYLDEKYDQAVIALERVIHSEIPYEEQDVESAYDKIIGIYQEQKDYESITRLLESSEDENIKTMFQQFIAYPPEFSYPEGIYNEVIPLKLSANTTGKIYYTIDGSMPDENSEVYTAPIFLETGNYTVSAFFVNDYGLKSDIVSNTYRIDLMVPPGPEVSTYSGDYTTPQMIVVEIPDGCDVFYTSDGTEPSAGSPRYTAPIPMPLGATIFKFIAISEEGVPSEVLIRAYNLTLNAGVTIEKAVSQVITALVKEDVLLDEQGNLRAMSGRNVYRFHAAVSIPDSGDFYVINEYYEDAAGNQTRTERIYAVNIADGIPYRLTYDENGKINLISFQ